MDQATFIARVIQALSTLEYKLAAAAIRAVESPQASACGTVKQLVLKRDLLVQLSNAADNLAMALDDVVKEIGGKSDKPATGTGN